jgi:hypothetical protein
MKRSSLSDSFKNEQNDLRGWVKEIHAGMYAKLDGTSIFRNYVDESSTFYDASSTALIASTVYRRPFPFAIRREIQKGAFGQEQWKRVIRAFHERGMADPVVDPHSFGSEGKESPEGQAFVVAMQAAWKDWVADGSKGANSARKGRVFGMGWVTGLGALTVWMAT